MNRSDEFFGRKVITAHTTGFARGCGMTMHCRTGRLIFCLLFPLRVCVKRTPSLAFSPSLLCHHSVAWLILKSEAEPAKLRLSRSRDPDIVNPGVCDNFFHRTCSPIHQYEGVILMVCGRRWLPESYSIGLACLQQDRSSNNPDQSSIQPNSLSIERLLKTTPTTLLVEPPS